MYNSTFRANSRACTLHTSFIHPSLHAMYPYCVPRRTLLNIFCTRTHTLFVVVNGNWRLRRLWFFFVFIFICVPIVSGSSAAPYASALLILYYWTLTFLLYDFIRIHIKGTYYNVVGVVELFKYVKRTIYKTTNITKWLKHLFLFKQF
jgi:hypothetical protein